MVIYVDIDGTICTWEKDGHYENAKPIQENIDKINKLYDEGNEIVYWTARGMRTGKNWLFLTQEQLIAWKCKFHALKANKPFYDLMIDDKSKRIEEIC